MYTGQIHERNMHGYGIQSYDRYTNIGVFFEHKFVFGNQEVKEAHTASGPFVDDDLHGYGTV
jgi:hypothetical protein